MTGNVQLYLTGRGHAGRIQRRMAARLGGFGGGVKGGASI